jgi:predicted  nucleic acid-binding Zn-ribbon protein
MKERLLALYKLSRIDKELAELDSLKGDIPAMIDDLSKQRSGLEDGISALQTQLDEIISSEKSVVVSNDSLTKKIDKNDNLLRSGAVRSNEEYNALAQEIEDAYEKIDSNEKLVESEYKGKKVELEKKLTDLKAKFEEINANLIQNESELNELGKQNEEEENELRVKRNEALSGISPEDLQLYERINSAMYGDAVAVVRKGSCLGCYSSIPPQRSIEIRTANRFFNCEACGRLLIAEELIKE